MNIYLDLFLTFARVGAMTFGGGYAMLPILEREVVDKKHWITTDDLNDYYAIGQCTPGVIAVNTATFAGHKQKGRLGGIIASLGVVAPSFFIILIIAAFLRNFAENPYVIHAFAGIRVAVTALVAGTVVKLWNSTIRGKKRWVLLLFLSVMLLSFFFDLSPVLLVLCSGAAGILVYYFTGKKEAEK